VNKRVGTGIAGNRVIPHQHVPHQSAFEMLEQLTIKRYTNKAYLYVYFILVFSLKNSKYCNEIRNLLYVFH